MRVFRRFLLCGGLAICPVAVCAVQSTAVQAAQPPRTPQADNTTHRPAEFAGSWTYNAADSVNAATGRPERAPRSATSRALPGAGAGNPGGGGGGGRGSGGGGGAAASGGPRVGDGGSAPDPSTTAPDYMAVAIPADSSPVGPTLAMVQESRDLSRDLLEVPEALTIGVAGGRVTFVDDLERTLSYPTDGTKQRYHLAASSFDAEVEWDGSQLRKRIQGAFGFRMTETYFLSSDGQRLFVVIRIGEQKKKTDRVVGVNRVYDRLPSR